MMLLLVLRQKIFVQTRMLEYKTRKVVCFTLLMTEIGQSSAPAASGPGDLFQLLRNRPRTKAELAAITGLARSTVSSRINLLLGTGLIFPAGEAASSGGRPPARVAFNPRARMVLAVDLGATHAHVAVSDLNGEILSSRGSRLAIAEGPDTVLEWVINTAFDLLRESGRDLSELAGVGIGVPGPVEHSTGRPVNPPIMPGWDRFDIPAFVGQHLHMPVFVDNDVNLLALGEHARTWPAIEDLLFVKVSTGIGAGIISGGKLQRGAQGTAGDMGHVQVPYYRDSPRGAGDDRDLETIASGPAIASFLNAQGLAAETSEDVVDLVKAGNAAAIAATRQAGREVGEVIATMVNMLNPSIIVLGGSIARAGEHLLAGVREVVYKRSIPLATQDLQIVQTQAGETAGVLGAAVMVIQQALSPASIDRMTSSF